MGAGGSLVVAGLICLIAASAMLAFRSWPGTDAGRPEGSLSLRTPAEKASGRAASGPLPAVALASATTARAGADTDARGGATTRTRGDAPGRSDRTRDRGPVATTPQPPANTTPPAAGAQPVPVTTTPPAGQGGEGSGSDGGSGSGGGGTGGGGGGGTTPAAGPVEQVVGTGRQTVNSLTAPLPVPPAVQQPVDEVLDTTENVARTVDGVVGQVPVAGETVGDVTGSLLP